MKKRVLFICIALFFIKFTAQNITQEPETSIDSMLINIDKTTFTSGILYDRVTPWAQLTTFNDSAKNVSNLKHFEQALHELYMASNRQKFDYYKNFRKKYTKESMLNVVDVGIINVSFQVLNYNTDNEDAGGLRLVNNVFEHIDGKVPFLPKHVLVVSPLKEYLVGQGIVFNFDKSFLFEEANTKKISKLTANFDTGQEYNIISDGKLEKQSIEVMYQKAGYRTLIFVASFEDGTTQGTTSKIHIKFPQAGQQRTMADPLVEDFTITSTIPFQGYDETSPIYGELEYRIFYHTNNGNMERKLLKPIVIIDGFDPEDKRKIQDSDSPKPANEHLSIEEFMIFKNNEDEDVYLIDDLKLLGYDVILVNHPTYTLGTKTIDGGADYIERNALNHVTLYQHLNNAVFQNGSSEKLVIVGPSMGGQISRYALAYMEKNNIPHNVRLWVSIDSPHLGANIPIGIQSMVNLLDAFGNSVAAADLYNNNLKSIASNQQLIEQHLEYHLPDYLNGGSPVHQQYYNSLFANGLPNSDGYPLNLRKVAIVNGSLNGVNVGVAGEEDFRVHGFLDQLWWDVKITEMNTTYMPNTGDTKQVARFWRELMPLRTATYTNNNPNGSMDIVPGGLFNSEDQIHSAVMGESPGLGDWGNGINFMDYFLANLFIFGDHFESRTNKEVHSFIPTVSSLGFKIPNFNWSQKLDRNLVCSNEIPFDSYFGPNVNEQHTSFTEESVNWLLKELAGNPQEPYFPINVNDLVGQASACDRQEATFSFNPCKTPNVSNWQVSSNLQIVSSNGTSVTVKPPTDSRTTGWIKANFANGNSVTKNIWVGKPTTPASLTGPSTVNTGALVSYKAGISNGATSYTWYLPYPYTTVSSFDYFGQDWQLLAPGNSAIAQTFTGYAQNAGYVQVMGTNNCGTGSVRLLYVQHGSGGGGGIPRIDPTDNVTEVSLYPNPAKNKVTVSLTHLTEYDGEPPTVIYGIKIMDLSLVERQFYQFKEYKNQEEINISFLPTGLYGLIVYTDTATFTKKLLVE